MYRQRRPIEPLRPWVEWLWHSRRSEVTAEQEIAVPTGANTITIRLDGDPIRIQGPLGWETFHEGVMWGTLTGYAVRDTARLGSVVGVQFRPGRAAAFLGCPAGEWSERVLPFEFAGEMDFLRNAIDPIAAVEELLLRRRPNDFDVAVDWAVWEIVRRPELVRIEALRRECGYSVRRFQEGFVAAVGIGPKRFARVRRLGRALAGLAKGDADLAGLALDCGYADQAHLTREFQVFAGMTPRQYRPVRPDWLHHVAIESEKNLQDKFPNRSLD